MGPRKKESRQLPNTDPGNFEPKNRGGPSWTDADWDSWEYYWRPYMTGYGENIPLMQGIGKGKGGKSPG